MKGADTFNDGPGVPLGPPIRPEPVMPPAPRPEEVAPGVFRGGDGRWSTNVPAPKGPP